MLKTSVLQAAFPVILVMGVHDHELSADLNYI